ncbi:hypothetical protein NGF19_06290 [Streptomyces sp. RY43-2]|uniref:Secreted protein n=1 Tax=Streptomyces macrolidinus TaxID=2952607 RepID=A0ABT0ZC77_9ACTN|nr:hypothetical protein [Streptomyces macrolidinus]MCN9240406.1 hypothetical protein [Streptomyces macrolidinus]
MKRTRAAGVALVAAALLFDGTGAAYAATTHASPSAHPHVRANASHSPTKRQIIDVLGPTSAVNTGLYRFTRTMSDGRWVIANRHSSVVPTELGRVLSGRQSGS